MPTAPTYPGVYIEEVPSGVHTITGVATSITAFVGRAWKGPLDEPIKINSFADYERVFGGLWSASLLSYAVEQFFANGGNQALVVRVATRTGNGAAKAATFSLTGGMKLEAASAGSWGMNLLITVEDKTKTRDPNDNKLFNLLINDDSNTKNDSDKGGGSGAREVFRNVSTDPNSPRFIETILAEQSTLERLRGSRPPNATSAQGDTKADAKPGKEGVGTTTWASAAQAVE